MDDLTKGASVSKVFCEVHPMTQAVEGQPLKRRRGRPRRGEGPAKPIVKKENEEEQLEEDKKGPRRSGRKASLPSSAAPNDLPRTLHRRPSPLPPKPLNSRIPREERECLQTRNFSQAALPRVTTAVRVLPRSAAVIPSGRPESRFRRVSTDTSPLPILEKLCRESGWK
ncbi:hypothetical protein E2C01_004088 [Portunus trituberculatus]|uniref:Uncharacterized protein n=1 Tax=Portunus trituberculatus TaxID=210409 RepID=A0A5B7CNZ1_PORTR|nr:hypothetical protein [Portunus trituberculatus]